MSVRKAVIFVAALTLVACRGKSPSTYLTQAVDKGSLREQVTATGEVSARIKVNVGSQVSGTIAKLNVDFNSKVKKGDILAELDQRLFVAQLQRYEASVAVAQAEVEKVRVTLFDTERTLRRYTELAKDKMAAQADLDNAQVLRDGAIAGLKSAEAGLLQAQADRDQYTTNLSLTKIRSPIDGVVIDRQVDVGQTVAASFQVATLFTIANDMRQMQVLANIDEADVGKVRAGMPANFTVDAYPGETFTGVLRALRRAPLSSTTSTSTTASTSSSSSGAVVTYAAVIDVENPEEKLLQGMTAQVILVSAQHDNALRIPNAALRYRPKGDVKDDAPADADTDADDNGGDAAKEGAPKAVAKTNDKSNDVTVYVLDNKRPAPRRVRLGLGDGRFVEILKGLNEGDNVIVGDTTAAAAGGGRGGRRGPF